MKTLATSIVLASVSLAASSVHAETANAPQAAEAAPSAPATHLDIEVDPTAYILGGYSVHVGLGWRRLRLDLGAYAMDVPRFVHGSDDFDVSFSGVGAKLQWFPFAEQRGAFIDVSGGVANQKFQLVDSELRANQWIGGVGIDFGWRFSLPARFYATTWAGVGYDFGVDDVMLGGKTLEVSNITMFAAIHLGYSFR